MPQRGIGLQPRVAAWATLGKKTIFLLNRNAVVSHCLLRKRRNRVAVEILLTGTQGSRSGNPGLKVVAPLGINENLGPPSSTR